MKPSKILAAQLTALLIADTTTIAHGTNAVKVGLITNNVTPSLETLIGDLTICALTGLVAISGVVGNQLESVNPLNGELEAEIKVPAGGFRWETPSDFAGDVSIYGYALMNSAASALYGVLKLDEAIRLNSPNQAITAPPLKFRIDPNVIH